MSNIVRQETKQEISQEKNIEDSEDILPEIAGKTEEIIETPKGHSVEGWKPKTELGKKVVDGKIQNIDQIFDSGARIREPQIVEALLPGLENEIILIGGSTGKGGGIKRTSSRRTTRMHKSGRRFNVSVMSVVGNCNGYVGVGLASGPPGKNREIIEKSLNKAKLNLIPIRRGCGSWECKCGTSHSIPFKVIGKAGSVNVEFLPAPKGVGPVVMNEMKKFMRLAGVKDIWCKSRGNTGARINLIKAVFFAFKKLGAMRTEDADDKILAIKLGRVD